MSETPHSFVHEHLEDGGGNAIVPSKAITDIFV